MLQYHCSPKKSLRTLLRHFCRRPLDPLKPISPMRTITEIIIHCTATRPNAICTVESIRRYHRSLGWHDIGYHRPLGPPRRRRWCPLPRSQRPKHWHRLCRRPRCRRPRRRHPHRSPAPRPPPARPRFYGRTPYLLYPRPQRVRQPRLPLLRRPAMEKGEQTLTAESGIIYKIYKISCAVRRIGEYQDLLKYE